MFRLVSPPLEGASTAPTIFLKDERGDVVCALDVSSLPYDQLKLLLHELGFYRKEDLKDPSVDEIVRPIIQPALHAIGPGAILQEDNASAHRARVVRDFM
nr:hypothetical protein BaRGS_005025 [Batillaria attramentaria]